MKRIFKYELDIVGVQTISMPPVSKILCVQTQSGKPVIWVETEFNENNQIFIEKQIEIYFTGGTLNELENSDLAYIGTFQMMAGALIYHVYERVEKVK